MPESTLMSDLVLELSCGMLLGLQPSSEELFFVEAALQSDDYWFTDDEQDMFRQLLEANNAR